MVREIQDPKRIREYISRPNTACTIRKGGVTALGVHVVAVVARAAVRFPLAADVTR